MASNAHSIKFGLFQRPMADVIETVRQALRQLPDVQPGGNYTLSHWSDDESEHDIVAMKQGRSREALPVITEKPHTFNAVSFTLHLDLPETALQFLIIVRGKAAAVHVGVVFMSDILEEGSLGSSGVVKLLDTLLPALGKESALLCDKGDEGAVDGRLWAGESLSSIILARAKGEDPLPPPLLALLKADLCDDATLGAVREAGVKVRLTLKKHVVFSIVDL
jgi:hypothetical protein